MYMHNLHIHTLMRTPPHTHTHKPNHKTKTLNKQVAAALDVVEQAIRLYGADKVFASYNGGKVRPWLRGVVLLICVMYGFGMCKRVCMYGHAIHGFP